MQTLKVLEPKSFPPLLREIPEPPKKLYLEGTLPDPSVFSYLAVVGSRKYSDYGKEVCRTLIEGLAGYPIAIVSGLALGIDAIAHEAALKAGLPTIAVPGSGLSDHVLYPASHRSLARKIVERGGALLSEFEPDFRATLYSFPQRNRIMAGLSHAVLIIEAERRSGTLITARLALDYNRDVLTVPGSIFSKNTEGPFYLIRNGATPISGSADILDALNLAPEGLRNERDTSDCSDDEKKMLELLHTPLPKDVLIEESGLPAHVVNTLVSMLEIKGLLQESGGEIRRI